MAPKRNVPAKPDPVSPMRSLIQRLGSERNSTVRIITFIAARAGEGTSTVARDYALALAAESRQKTLLIDAGLCTAQYSLNPLSGIVDEFVAGRSPLDALYEQTGISFGRWIKDHRHLAASAGIIQSAEIWKILGESFDFIVIDAPSLQASFDGIMLAAKADKAVLVVEAEKTPEPVIRNLRDTLIAAGANVAGMVMNKRRYYIPDKIYGHL